LIEVEKEVLVAEVQQKADELQEVRSAAMNSILAAMIPHGGLTKITQKASKVATIGAGIFAVLSILLSRTQPTTRLWVVCEALFLIVQFLELKQHNWY
jgi:hypothetical protein